MITAVAVLVGAFVVMEPITYLTHRFVMHGFAIAWHRSHHRRWVRPRGDGDSFFEANDGFPVVFAAATMLALAVGFNVEPLQVLLPAAAGATLYGAAYAFVHDVYIHQRVRFTGRCRTLDRLAAAHALHHRYGGEPFGMLVPVIPPSLRRRAERDQGVSPERVRSTPRP